VLDCMKSTCFCLLSQSRCDLSAFAIGLAAREVSCLPTKIWNTEGFSICMPKWICCIPSCRRNVSNVDLTTRAACVFGSPGFASDFFNLFVHFQMCGHSLVGLAYKGEDCDLSGRHSE